VLLFFRVLLRQRAEWQPVCLQADVEHGGGGFVGKRPRTPQRNTARRCTAITEHAVAAQKYLSSANIKLGYICIEIV